MNYVRRTDGLVAMQHDIDGATSGREARWAVVGGEYRVVRMPRGTGMSAGRVPRLGAGGCADIMATTTRVDTHQLRRYALALYAQPVHPLDLRGRDWSGLAPWEVDVRPRSYLAGTSRSDRRDDAVVLVEVAEQARAVGDACALALVEPWHGLPDDYADGHARAVQWCEVVAERVAPQPVSAHTSVTVAIDAENRVVYVVDGGLDALIGDVLLGETDCRRYQICGFTHAIERGEHREGA